MQGYLEAARFNFKYYRELAEKAVAQVEEGQLHWKPDAEANSIAIIMQHLAGNLVSRWTDFLTSDGEKASRDRDEEFVDGQLDRVTLMRRWERGWTVLSDTLNALSEADLGKTVTIRGKAHTVVDAIERGLSHAAYHVGQITYIARMLKGAEGWQTLSIARNQSAEYRPKDQR